MRYAKLAVANPQPAAQCPLPGPCRLQSADLQAAATSCDPHTGTKYEGHVHNIKNTSLSNLMFSIRKGIAIFVVCP